VFGKIYALLDKANASLDAVKSNQTASQANEERISDLVASKGEEIVDLLDGKTESLGKELLGITRSLDDHSRYMGKQLKSVKEAIDRIDSVLQQYVMPTHDQYSYSPETSAYRLKNPEFALVQHLRSFLPSRNALDIGANNGNVSEIFLSAGFRVFAFEPGKEPFQQLSDRFMGNADFKAFPFAVGSDDGTRQMFAIEVAPEAAHLWDKNLSLYSTVSKHPLPDKLRYTTMAEVPVRSLKSLHQAAQIPVDIGIVKIDTEGGDIDVIKGMGAVYYPCVITEFWDAKHPFSANTAGLLHQTVIEMRRRGYNWHIVVYRLVDENNAASEPRFYANINQSPEHAIGNVIFFKEHALFIEAYNWCRANVKPNEMFR
jgi:FkbM family methyltransferase